MTLLHRLDMLLIFLARISTFRKVQRRRLALNHKIISFDLILFFFKIAVKYVIVKLGISLIGILPFYSNNNRM